MKDFEIYRRDQHPRYRAVKKGFSWPGLLITGMWLIAKRMYLFAVLYSLFMFPMNLISSEPGFDYADLDYGYLYLIVFTLSFFYWGFFGNRTWAWHLRRKGYQRVAVVQSGSASAAIGLYLATLTKQL